MGGNDPFIVVLNYPFLKINIWHTINTSAEIYPTEWPEMFQIFHSISVFPGFHAVFLLILSTSPYYPVSLSTYLLIMTYMCRVMFCSIQYTKFAHFEISLGRQIIYKFLRCKPPPPPSFRARQHYRVHIARRKGFSAMNTGKENTCIYRTLVL